MTNNLLDFISNLQKQSLELLRFSLEAEIWAPTDIPYDYNPYFGYLLGNESNHHEGHDPNAENFDDVLKSARPDVNDLDIVRNLANANEDDQVENSKENNEPVIEKPSSNSNQEIFTINRSDVFFHNKRYKVTNSFLQLLKVSVDYLKIAPKFKHAGMDLVAKLFEIIKV